ncbi:MAG: hypothetical protein OHK0046_45540 [Anaerolineae bacterium]
MVEDINVLLVEDNPGDARLIQEMLRSTDQQIITLDLATTLAEAIEQIKTNTYQAILLDLSLPDSHGIDTLLRVEAEALDTVVVVLTGLSDEAMGVEAVQMGAQDYLLKDAVDDRLLRRSIRYAIERNRTELALRQSEEEYRSLIDDVFDTSMVAVLILDRHFNVVWCNEATEIYFGLDRDLLLGRDKRKLIDNELKCIFADPDDYASRLLNAYTNSEFTHRFECHVLVDDRRQERWLEHWSQPIRDGLYAGGRIEQYTDITDRKHLEIAEREQRDFAHALHEISTLLTSSLDLKEVLARILSNLDRVVPHDWATITIIEDDHFQTARQPNHEKRDTQEVVAEKQIQLDYKPYAEIMFMTQEPVIIPDLRLTAATRAEPVGTAPSHYGNLHAYVGAPILLQDNVIGFIHLLSEKTNFFTEDHAGRLSAFSRLAAIAIQNARLFDRSRQLAALEERQRLARDLHDSVSQTLFTCRTMSETALRRWKKDPVRAYELMREVNQLTATALAEMRILLLELRPAALTRVGLKQLFEQYLQPMQDRREFELIMSIDNIPLLPPEVQIALYRITQEALNNIDKHAQATEVEVRAQDGHNGVVLEIRDNGRGFIFEETKATSFGLGIMRERADEIGASIEINSAVNQGTRIKVIWNRKEAS